MAIKTISDLNIKDCIGRGYLKFYNISKKKKKDLLFNHIEHVIQSQNNMLL